METDELYTAQVKTLVAKALHTISFEKEIVQTLEALKERSEKTIGSSYQEIKDLVYKVFVGNVVSGSALDKFLKQKPIMPHEYNENYLHALATILADLLLDDYGKTTSGGVEQFSFFGAEGHELWKAIHNDFEKILKDFFGVTPFLDDTRSTSYIEIGFSVDAKWPKEQTSA